MNKNRKVGRHCAPHPSWPADIPPGSVILGKTSRGKYIWIPPELRKLGVHIVGLPNQGKSKLMESMWRQNVLALCGTLRTAIFVCPHGASHNANLNWIATHGIDRSRTVRVLDISDPEFIVSLNPAKCRPGVDPAVVGAAVRDAILRGTYGKSGLDPSAQPQTLEALDITFTTVAEFGASFADAFNLLDLEDTSGFRQHAAEHSENPIVRSFWRRVEGCRRPSDREAYVGAALRRVERSILAKRSREMLSEARNVIDWRQVFDNYEVVLVNFSYDQRGIVSEDQALTLGALVMNDMFSACRGRTTESPSVDLFWDEAHRFMTEAAARLFTEARKFNLHPIFAHQIFEQLDETSPFIKGAIMSCRNKIFFGGLPPADADFAARFAFRGQLDFEKPKHLFDKPVVVGQELAWVLNESNSHAVGIAEGTNWSRGGSESTSIGNTQATSETTSTSANMGTSVSRDPDGEPVGEGQSEGTGSNTSGTESLSETTTVSSSTNWSEGGSGARTVTDTMTAGRAQTFKSVFRTMPTTAFSLPELLEMASARIAGLGQGEAIVKIGKRPAAKINTIPVRTGWASPEHIARVTARIAANTPYVHPADPAATAAQPITPKELPAPSEAPGVPGLDQEGSSAPKSKQPPLDPEWG